MSDDALTRLEAWLRADKRRSCRQFRDPWDGNITVALRWSDGKLVHVSAPDLATAIHAALDRAAEAGL